MPVTGALRAAKDLLEARGIDDNDRKLRYILAFHRITSYSCLLARQAARTGNEGNLADICRKLRESGVEEGLVGRICGLKHFRERPAALDAPERVPRVGGAMRVPRRRRSCTASNLNKCAPTVSTPQRNVYDGCSAGSCRICAAAHFPTAHWQLTDSNPSQIQSHCSAEAKAQPACSNLAQVATVIVDLSYHTHPPPAQTRQPRLPLASEWQLGAHRHGVRTGPLAVRATGRPQPEWRPELGPSRVPGAA